MKKFSIIIPVYKNEKNIPITIPYIMDNLSLFNGYDVEVIMVSDGSPDNSYDLMKEYKKKYPHSLKIVQFTKNFGQGAAIHCGMDMASGDVYGIISADLQDPFELFVDMLKYWEEGYKLVIGERKNREETGLGAFCSKTLHRIVNKYVDKRYPKGGFDFFLIDRGMAEAYKKMDIPNASMQMLLIWMGDKTKVLPYERRKREIGKSSWSIPRKIDAASGLLVSYSKLPLRISFLIGGIIALINILLIIVMIILGANKIVAGSNLFICLGVIGVEISLIFFVVGIIGEYLWRMYELQKQRPRYRVDEDVYEKQDGNVEE